VKGVSECGTTKVASTYLLGIKRADHKLLHHVFAVKITIILIVVLILIIANRHFALGLDRLDTVDTIRLGVILVVLIIVNIHTLLLSKLADHSLHTGLLALGGVTRTTSQVLILVILVVLRTSEHSVHAVDIELIIILVILTVVVVLIVHAKRLADDLERRTQRLALLTLRYSAGVDGSHGNAEGGGDIALGLDCDIAWRHFLAEHGHGDHGCHGDGELL